jgi:1-acyl-sn-glycerol-3-phosphate acyltransferase
MKKIRAIWRGIAMLAIIVSHILWVVIPAIFRGANLKHALRIRQLCLTRTLSALGIVIDKKGEVPSGHHIFVGNHRSYIDPIVALRDVRALPVAKAEVSNWPVIGFGARVTGIMFVKRDSKKSRADVLAAMRETLKMGYSVIIFPEGTTHIEPTTVDFRTGAFNMASKEGFSMVPMAIDYKDLGDAWIGNDTFIPHFLRCFSKPKTFVKIRYGQPIQSEDINYLVSESKKWIDENMLLIRQEFESEKTSSTVPAFAT